MENPTKPNFSYTLDFKPQKQHLCDDDDDAQCDLDPLLYKIYSHTNPWHMATEWDPAWPN